MLITEMLITEMLITEMLSAACRAARGGGLVTRVVANAIGSA